MLNLVPDELAEVQADGDSQQLHRTPGVLPLAPFGGGPG